MFLWAIILSYTLHKPTSHFCDTALKLFRATNDGQYVQIRKTNFQPITSVLVIGEYLSLGL